MDLTLSYGFYIAFVARLISANQDKPFTALEQAEFAFPKMFPKLNYSCLANGCPELLDGFSSICPSNDYTLRRMVTNAHACMTKPLCGVVLDPNQVPTTTFYTVDKSRFGNSSVCSTLEGGAFSHTSHAIVTDISRTPQQVNISVELPDITVHVAISCQDGKVNMSIDHIMTFTYHIIYNKTHITIINPKFNMIYMSFNYLSPEGHIIKKLTQFDPKVIYKMGKIVAGYYEPFLTHYYGVILEILLKDCNVYLDWN